MEVASARAPGAGRGSGAWEARGGSIMCVVEGADDEREIIPLVVLGLWPPVPDDLAEGRDTKDLLRPVRAVEGVKVTEPRAKYDDLIEGMPAGLDRAVLRVLRFHVGLDLAIGKPQFLIDLARMGFGVDERQLRRQIQELRQAGHLICATSGVGGYYLANNREEYDAFSESEYRSKIVDMATTLQAMDQAALVKFGPKTTGAQGSLF
jgi:hypothetical protein